METSDKFENTNTIAVNINEKFIMKEVELIVH